MQVASQNVVVLLDFCRAWTNKTRETASSCEGCHARRFEMLLDKDVRLEERVLYQQSIALYRHFKLLRFVLLKSFTF